MQVDIKTRHFNLGDEQKEKIAASFDKLARFSPRPIIETKVVLTHEAGRFSGDAVMFLRNNEFRAGGAGVEPELAVAEMVESLRKQLSKFKGKISGRQQGEEGGLGRALGFVAAGDEGGDLESEGFELRDMGVEEAVRSFRAADRPFLVFRNVATARVGVVYKRKDGEIGLMEATTN